MKNDILYRDDISDRKYQEFIKKNIKFKNYKNNQTGKKYKVAILRVKGVKGVLARRNIKGSGLKSIDDFAEVFTNNKTFNQNVRKRRIQNSKTIEIQTFSTNSNIQVKRKNNAQYFVTIKIKRGNKIQRITGWSLKFGSPLCETEQKCIDYAWENLHILLGGMGDSGDVKVGRKRYKSRSESAAKAQRKAIANGASEKQAQAAADDILSIETGWSRFKFN